MLKRIIKAVQGKRLARWIRTVRPDLADLPDQKVIEQYLEDCLVERQNELNTFKASIADPDAHGGFRYPTNMSKLFERVLLYDGDKPKAFYIQQTYLLARESSDLEYQLEEIQERNERHHELNGNILELAKEAVTKLEGIERNQDVNSITKSN